MQWLAGVGFLNWIAPKPRGVLYLDGEMQSSEIQKRLAAIVCSHQKEATAKFSILTPDLQESRMPDLSTIEGQQMIKAHLDGIELIIVDNISTLCRSGRENEAEDWLIVQDWALQMRASGRSVLFIHHAGKGGKQRGTSKREDVLDTVISLKQPADYEMSQGSIFELHYEKARGFSGKNAEPLQVILDSESQQYTFEALEKSSYEKVISLALEGLAQSEIAQELELDKSRVSRHIKRAKQEGKLP